MQHHVTFGLIGLGGISQSQHLPNLSRAANIRLLSACDLRQELVDATCARYQIPQGETDYRRILADPRIDAVLIATRPQDHVELTLAALQAGKHVYVEKPLAESVEECRGVVQAQRQSEKLLAIGFNRRMAPAYQKVREIFRAHGGPRNIHYRLTDAYHIWGAAFPPGVRVVHEAGHIFDLLRFLSDSEVTSVYCAAARADDECIVLTFASGCVAGIMSSGYVQYDMPKESLEAVVDLGALIVTEFIELRTFGLEDFPSRMCFAGHVHPDHDITHRGLFAAGDLEAMFAIRKHYRQLDLQLKTLRSRQENVPLQQTLETELQRLPLINYMVDKGWLPALEHFARAILGQENLQLAGAFDGLQTARITQAAIQSRESGTVVKLDAQP